MKKIDGIKIYFILIYIILDFVLSNLTDFKEEYKKHEKHSLQTNYEHNNQINSPLENKKKTLSEYKEQMKNKKNKVEISEKVQTPIKEEKISEQNTNIPINQYNNNQYPYMNYGFMNYNNQAQNIYYPNYNMNNNNFGFLPQNQIGQINISQINRNQNQDLGLNQFEEKYYNNLYLSVKDRNLNGSLPPKNVADFLKTSNINKVFFFKKKINKKIRKN